MHQNQNQPDRVQDLLVHLRSIFKKLPPSACCQWEMAGSGWLTWQEARETGATLGPRPARVLGERKIACHSYGNTGVHTVLCMIRHVYHIFPNV